MKKSYYVIFMTSGGLLTVLLNLIILALILKQEQLSKVEIGNLPNKEFKVMIVKLIRELGRRMDEQSEK